MCFTTKIPNDLENFLHVRGYRALFIDDVEYDEDVFINKTSIIDIMENLVEFNIICSVYKVMTIIRIVKKEMTPDLYLEHYGSVSDWKNNIELANRVNELELLLGQLMSQLTKIQQ